MTKISPPETIGRSETDAQSKSPPLAAKPSLNLTYIVQKGANALPFLRNNRASGGTEPQRR
jgi:hypothetical protein